MLDPVLRTLRRLWSRMRSRFPLLQRIPVPAIAVALALGGSAAAAWLGPRLLFETLYVADLFRESTCVGCHVKLHPDMVRQWKESPHFTAGVGCAGCHGSDHVAILGKDGVVSARECGEACHTRQYEEFKLSGHSQPVKGQKADLLFEYPDRVAGCTLATGCHVVRTEYEDGSTGKCSVCHPGHGFSLEVSRDPQVCVTCHTGSNNTEVVEYEQSMHGVLYRVGGAAAGGPTCVTCHMPGGSHDDRFGLTELVLEPGDPPLTFVHTMEREAFDLRRAEMLSVCADCHGLKLARRALQEGDAFRKKGAYMLEEAAAVVRGLYQEGLLDPMPHMRVQNPYSGPELMLGSVQLFDRETSAAERLFYRMYMFTYSAAYRRVYHNTPSRVRWHENEMLKDDLIMIQAEARRLRTLARAGILIPQPPPGPEQLAAALSGRVAEPSAEP